MTSRVRSRAESNKSRSSPGSKNGSSRAKSSLMDQEEEYKKLNAELEAKTAALVREAEAIMTEQDHFLMESSPHKSPSLDDLSSNDTDEDITAPSTKEANIDQYSKSAISGLLDLVDNDGYELSDDVRANSARVSSRSTKSSSSLSSRRPASVKIPKRPNTGSSKSSKRPVKKASTGGNRADDVAVPSDFMSKLTLDGAISNIEKNLDGVSARDYEDDDILPGAAAEMGSEAQIRFLKAKLRVMQEEVDKLSHECHSGNEERKKLNLALKNATEEQTRLQKNNNAQQVQIEKHKKLLAEEKRKSESVGVQVQNLRKELDGLKREQKQTSVTHNATEVRLNRALEDVERYKSQLQKDKNSNKESAENDRREMERLRLDNKRLERLKNEMNTVFKKQQKLISILKRQILHIEAAKLLSFTEEEFVRALDWGILGNILLDGCFGTMSFPLKLDVVSSKTVKSKKRWKKIQWDGEESEYISLLGTKTLAQFNLVSGKKRRVDASLRKVLGRVVYITGSLSGACVVGLLQDGNLFRWRKNTRTITNIGPCPDFTNSMTDTNQGHVARKLKLFISDDGSTLILISQWHGVRLWRSIGNENSGWTNINVGPTMPLITSKGVNVDTIFYSDEIIGKICRSAFVGFSGDTIFAAVLFLRYEENESSQNYAFHKYSLSDFNPGLAFTTLRDSLIPCWSRNGSTLAVAVNQPKPSSTKILLINPISGGIITVNFSTLLKNAVDMSFWITALSWTQDNLFLACVTKQGAIALISANGFIMKIMVQSPTEGFGPGIFLPLEGVLGFKGPAVDIKYPEIDDSTDASMQSTVLPPKRRKPHYSISMHPTLKLLLCADGYSVAVLKLMENITFVDTIVFGLVEIVQRISKVVKESGLQIEILEPLSFFLPLQAKDVTMQSDKEERWRKVIKIVQSKLYPEQSLDANGEEIEKSPEQLALISFLKDNLDDSLLNRSLSQHEASAIDSTVQAGAVTLAHDLKLCHTGLLSTLIMMKMWFAQKNDSAGTNFRSNNEHFTKNELIIIYSDTFKLYCDILLQVQDIADILPDESINDSNLSSNGKPLRVMISKFVSSLGKGVLSALHWIDLSMPISSIIPSLVEEIVRTTLSCGTHSSEGCISSRDMQRNVKKALKFLIEAEKCYIEQSQRHMQAIFGMSMEHGWTDGRNDEIRFANAWRMLYKLTTKVFPKGDPLLAHLQYRLSENVMLPSQDLANEDIKATKSLLLMCETLGNYDLSKAISLAYDILSMMVTHHKKWTAEKWLPIEVLATTMCSYFCGAPVHVPSLMAAISRYDSKDSLYNHSMQLQQKKITSSVRSESLDECWKLDNAVLLLLCCGRISEAGFFASDIGDWRTSFVLHAVSEKIHYLPKYTQNVRHRISTNLLLEKRCEDIISSMFGVKVQINDDCFSMEDKSKVKFYELDAAPYAKSLTDMFEISTMIGQDLTTWTTSALLNTIKSVCLAKMHIQIPVGFKLPHPQLFLPQSFARDSVFEGETSLRHELSTHIRLLLTIFNSIGVQRIVALWYLKWMHREVKTKNDESSQKLFLDEFALLKDVTRQGMELSVERRDTSRVDFEIYFLAAVFREVCAILWFFHLRDKLAVSLRRYQNIREEIYDPCCKNDGISAKNDVTVDTMYEAIHDCLFWVEKLVPFSDFFQIEVEIQEMVLCLASELPYDARCAKILAEYFFHERKIAPKNKHRLQAILDRMRNVVIQDSTENSGLHLSSIFENECQKYSKQKNSFSGHFHTTKNLCSASVDGSQSGTLSRDELSVKSKISADELMETLKTSYVFESDDIYHKFVFDFLEIALKKSPATATFTPNKDGKNRSSMPMQFPLVLTYRSEIAKMNLETILQPVKSKDVSLTMKVPVFEKYVAKNLGSVESDTSNAEDDESSAMLNWEYFKKKDKILNNPKPFRLESKSIPRLSLKTMSPQFCKKLQRLSSYFEWLEHWRSRIVTMPQNFALCKDVKPAMRVTISLEHIFHGFTVAEMRFGRLGKARPPTTKVTVAKKPDAVSDVTGEAISSPFSSEPVSEIASEVEEKDAQTQTNVDNVDHRDHAISDTKTDTDVSVKVSCTNGQTVSVSVQHTDAPHEMEKDPKSAGDMMNSQEENSVVKKQVAEESLPKAGEERDNFVPDPSGGKLLGELLQKDTSEDDLVEGTEQMSQSNVTVTSTGLQSDIIPDGGGKVYPLRNPKLREKEEMKDVVRTEIQNAMIGQQVLFLAQMFQSAMMHASNVLNQTQQTTTIPEYRVSQTRSAAPMASTPKKKDETMQILTADGYNTRIEQKSQFAQKPKRPVLRLLTENTSPSKSRVTYLHDENANGPKLFIPQQYKSKEMPKSQPLLHRPNVMRTEQPSNNAQNEKSFKHEAPTLTPEMLQGTDGQCQSCKSQPTPKMNVKLPLLNLASAISTKSQYTQPVNALPRLIHIRQILRHEQNRMNATGQLSQSVAPMAKAMPLLSADKIPGFYKQVPNFQHVPSSIRFPQSTRQPPIKPAPAWGEGTPRRPVDVQQEMSDGSKVEIPKELLPKVLTSEEADAIKNGVLAHYKTIVDHQKLMWKEAGQQTEEADDKVDTGVGPFEVPEQRPVRPVIPPEARYASHQQFVEKFLDPQRNKLNDLDQVPIKELKAQDVTHMQDLEDQLKVPTVQNLVKSRFISVMDHMSSEMDAVDQVHKDIRSRTPITYEDPREKSASTSSSVHFAPQVPVVDSRDRTTSSTSSVHFAPLAPQNFKRSQSPVSVTGVPMEPIARSSFPSYIPTSEVYSGMDVAGSKLDHHRENRLQQHPVGGSKLDELSRYRRKIDEAFNLAGYGPTSLDPGRHSKPASRQLTPASSIQRMDDGSLLSSLSWEELEAMVANNSLYSDADPDVASAVEHDDVDERMKDALQLLNELESEKPQIQRKTTYISPRQQKAIDARTKKREADVNARIEDAVNLLNEIKIDHNQVTRGKFASQKHTTPVKLSPTKPKAMDTWTLEAMSLLKELKSEFEPDQRAAVKENLPPNLFERTDSGNIRSHIEEAMALLQDDDGASSTQYSTANSSHVSFQPAPKRYY